MLATKKDLKAMITNFLKEGRFDDFRYPCNGSFLQRVSEIIYSMKYGKESGLFNSYNQFYNYFKTIYSTTKITSTDAKVTLFDHYENFKKEGDIVGSTIGLMQINAQASLDALRTEGKKLYDKSPKAKERSLKIRGTARDLFGANEENKNLLDNVDEFLKGEIDGDTVLSNIESILPNITEDFNIFLGLGYLMMPGVNSINAYVGNISETRQNRHDIIERLISLDRNTLSYFGNLNIITKYRLMGSIDIGSFSLALEKMEKDIEGTTVY